MKRLNPAISQYLQRDEIKYIHLFCIEKPNSLDGENEWIYLTDGHRPYRWADREEVILGNNLLPPNTQYSTFRADSIIEFSKIVENTEPKADSITITMYGQKENSYEYIIPHPNAEIGIGTYYGKKVRIYRAFLDEDDNIVGSPEYFRMAGVNGAVSELSGDLSGPTLVYSGRIVAYEIEEATSGPKIKWKVNNFWEGFNKVNNRITSDSDHRGLDEDGNPNPASLLKPEYANDLGFSHGERAVKLEASYQKKETRTKLKKSGGGFLSSPKYKLVEYTVWVTEKVKLDINTFARNIPVVYGTRYIDEPIIVFADTNLNNPEEVWLAYAICEGPAQALLDVTIDGKFLVCQDPEDAEEREEGSVPCNGLASQGDVLGAIGLDGQHWPVTHGDYIEIAKDIKIWFYAGLSYQHDLDKDVIYISQDNQVKRGVYGQPASYDIKKLRSVLNISPITEADYLIEEDTPEDFKLRNIIQNGNNTGLLYPTKESYFGNKHRLIDTCYAAVRISLSENGYTEVPDIGFVIKGKYCKALNRYAGDGDIYFPSNIAPNENPELDPTYWVSPDEYKLSSTWSVPPQNNIPPLTPVLVQRFLAEKLDEKGIPSLDSVDENNAGYYYNLDSIVTFNPVWQLLDYMTSTTYGAAIPIEFIDVDTVYEAAYKCYKMSKEYDSSFVKYWSRLTWSSGYTNIDNDGVLDKNRVDLNKAIHQCNVVIDTDTPVIENIRYMLDNFDGILTHSNGKFAIKVRTSIDSDNLAVYPWDTNTPVVITLSDIIGNISIKEDTSKRYNTVQASFIDPANGWKGRAVTFFNGTYLEQDAKVSKKGRFNLSAITNYYSARTKIKYYLRRSRDAKVYTFTLPHNYFFLEAGDVFYFKHEETGDVNLSDPQGLPPKLRIENISSDSDLNIQVTCSIYKEDHYELIGSGDGNVIEEPVLEVPKPAAPDSVTPSIVEDAASFDKFQVEVVFRQTEIDGVTPLSPTEKIGVIELTLAGEDNLGDPIPINYTRRYSVEDAEDLGGGQYRLIITIDQIFNIQSGYKYTFFVRTFNGKYSDYTSDFLIAGTPGSINKLPPITRFYVNNTSSNSNVIINGYYTFNYNYLDTVWSQPALLDLSGGKEYRYLFRIYLIDSAGNRVDTGETLTYPYTTIDQVTGVTNLTVPYYNFDQIVFFKALLDNTLTVNGLRNVPRALTMSIAIERADAGFEGLWQSDETFLTGTKENI